jgi:hypothetical protein
MCYNPVMKEKSNIAGKRFGKLKVLRFSHVGKLGKLFWVCLCKCGKQATIPRTNLVSGNTKSCGCGWKKHGHAILGHITPEYNIWNAMKHRCLNPRHKSYKNYGGRGIKICKRWNSFINFLRDMGVRPNPKLSLDRINNNGNYCPSNCRWATRHEQRINSRPRNHLKKS